MHTYFQKLFAATLTFGLCTASSLKSPKSESPITDESEAEIDAIIGVPIGPPEYNYWPNGRIPYVVDPSMTSEDIRNVNAAIADYHNKTCLNWVPRTDSSPAYVRFKRDVNGKGCAAADNCYTGGERNVYMEQCNGRDTYIHEMGHTICFGHEQDRNDKDSYIKDCSSSKYEHLNFGHLYDYRSIMHYFCDDCRVPTMPGVTKSDCGSPNGLSVLDAEKINDIYGCTGCRSHRFRFPFELDPDDSNQRLVVGGNEASGQPLYVCRAYIRGDIVSGKASVYNDDWTCWVGWGGQEHRLKNIEEFEVLITPRFSGVSWMRWNRGNQVPYFTIPAGRTVGAETMYIGRCRVTIDGRQTLIPGKVHGNNPTFMYYTYGGRESSCTDMDILVCREEGNGK